MLEDCGKRCLPTSTTPTCVSSSFEPAGVSFSNPVPASSTTRVRAERATIDAWEWDLFVGRWGGVEDPWYHPGHHRPDDPGDRRRNADHLGTNELRGTWPVRTPEIRCRPHRARLRPDTGDRPAE